MKLIQENPYRIAGILANASPIEFERQKARISRYAPLGRQVESDLDFLFLLPVDRTNVEKINKAFSDIEQRDEKVKHSLFWFINSNPFDETAIGYLKKGDIEKAIDIWEKKTEGKEITSKNYSCFNNIGTLKLLGESTQELKEGIEAKIKLIGSPTFEIFVHTVADQTYTIDNQKQTEKFLDDILEQFKGKYSNADTLELFSNCNGNTRKYLSQKFTEEPLHKIESQIDSCKKKRKKNKGNAYEFGLKLHTNTKDDLTLLKSILGTNDLIYKALADQLANEIMQCGIDYFNECQENNSRDNYLESSQKLTKLADSIAVGKMAKDRAKDSLATLEDMKDREINKAIAILSSIKLAYEKAISEIDAQVLQMTMRMSYNQTINYSKVYKMKAECLNWDKVVEVVSDRISLNDVEVIQHCSNQSKVSEYKNLVDFLIGKLGFAQTNRVKYLAYWIKNDTLACAQLTAKSLPFWAKWAGGFAVFLLLVGLIWGEEGLEVVFSIAGILGVLFFIEWLRSL